MPGINRTPHPLTVLVVDDYPDAAQSLAELLRLRGHSVAVALDGAAALRGAAAAPDVIFLDIRMPGADGYEVAARLRTRCGAGGKRPLLIALTCCGTESDRRRTAAAGFDLHLLKPVAPAVLIGLTERFRQFFTPPIPAAELGSSPEEAPDSWSPPHISHGPAVVSG
jgi:CheY-like chemotaxis protein